MKSHRRTCVTWMLLVVIGCSTLSIGCEPVNWFGPNMSMNFVIPLGLGGSPGIFNPFGLLQTLVYALLSGSSSTGGSTAYDTPSITPSSPSPIDPAQSVILG